MIKNKKIRKIIKNVVILGLTIGLAYLVASSDTFEKIVMQLMPISILAELVAGLFYTSFLTVPVSLSLFSVLSESSNMFVIVFVGALGATCGDYVLMKYIHKGSQKIGINPKKLKPLQKNKIAKVILKLVGILCLATPVPDEIAMSILGITKIKVRTFIFLVYPAKVFGIFAVVSSLKTLAPTL